MKKINIIIPVFNEISNIRLIVNKLDEIKSLLNNYEFKYIFVDDGSKDNTFEEIKNINKSYIKAVQLTRNFGKEAALTAGLLESENSDIYFTIDADLQHPPDLIPQMLKIYESDKDTKVVECVRKINKGYSFIRSLFSKFFYFLINNTTDTKISPLTTDFRLYDREVIEILARFKEKKRTLRILIDWIGFKTQKVEFAANQRIHGDTKYKFKDLVSLMINSITSYSTLPLKIILYLGTIILILFSVLFCFMIFSNFIIGNILFSNISFVIVAMAILLGIIMLALGLLGLYIGNIYREVLDRPLYVCKKKYN